VVRGFELLVRPDASPGAKAAAFAAGVFIGCLPLYGLHLVLSAVVARLTRLSLVRIYLGAHIGNPLTAAPLLYIQLGTGNLLLGRPWPLHVPSSLAQVDLAGLGMALVVGSLAVGAILSALTAMVTLRMARGWERSPQEVKETEEAARHYLDAGISYWGFARGKLRHDPLYGLLAGSRDLLQAERVLDLGCGIGLVLARLHERLIAAAGHKNDGSSPHVPDYLGLDASARRVHLATRCLGEWGTFQVADLAKIDLPGADVILLMDVLHYLPAEEQMELLDRVVQALPPGGVFMMREADAGGGWRFQATRIGERLRALLRGEWRQAFYYRSSSEWEEQLTALGLDVSAQSADQGTPFANAMLTARRPGTRGEV
jgi:uncharacterized protein (DUF2062 family)